MIDAVAPEAVAIVGVVCAAIVAYLRGNTDTARRKIITAETQLRAWMRTDIGLPTPAVEELDRTTIDTALETAIPAHNGTQSPIRTAYTDGTYLAPVAEDRPLLRAIGTLTSLLPYRPARFDCENFAGLYRALVAFVLGTNTIGVVYDWSGGHAYNVVVTADAEVHFYEPNGDEWVDIGEGPYTLTNALVVF